MSVIHISGLPREKNNQKQLKLLRLYIKRMGLSKSMIIDLFDTPDTDLVEATIEVPVDQNLYAFRDVVNKAPYKKINTGIRYPLVAKVVNDEAHRGKTSQGSQPSKKTQPKKKTEPQASRYNDNSNLDVELELLNKKQQLLEEQRKLLQESDKLQIMQDRGLEILSNPNNRDRARVPPPKKGYSVPLFVKPCSMLVKKCLPYINEQALDYERQMLTVVIRSRIRRELALLLSDRQTILPCAEIIRLYREKHPDYTDEAFVAQQLSDYVRCSFWPFQRKPKAKKNKKGNAAKKDQKPAVVGEKAENSNDQETTESMDTEEVVEVDASADVAEQEKVETAQDSEVVEDHETANDESNENNQVESTNVSNEELAMADEGNGDEDDWVANGVDWVDDDDQEENAASNKC